MVKIILINFSQRFDGVAGKLFRDITEPELSNLSWLLFNNTVLDDNKKLCLSNGETIRINGRDKYHSDLYRNYLENNIINK